MAEPEFSLKEVLISAWLNESLYNNDGRTELKQMASSLLE